VADDFVLKSGWDGLPSWLTWRKKEATMRTGRYMGDDGNILMSDLYETDILLWSERQAELLRRVAAGDRSNEAAPDWPNIIEEIESVGNEQRFTVESLLMQALIHILKARAWPQSRDVPHWEAEARVFRATAESRFTPSMRQRLDLDRIYRRALRGLPDTIDGQPGLPVPDACPLTLDELLAD
jgi:hypothetical protein